MERYFLGNNSGYGFWNDYVDELKNKDRVALLKGGPGTGKSTLMKKVAQAIKKAGCDYELWYCSGDPQSLDGVYIKDTNRAVVDATAPHASGVDIPVIKDRIFDLAEGLKPYKLKDAREGIEKLIADKKQCFVRVYQHLKCALCHLRNKFELEKQAVDEAGIRVYAHKIADVLRRENANESRDRKLFARAICPSGENSYFDHLRNARIYLAEGCEYAKSVFFDELSKIVKGCFLLQNPLEPHVYEGIGRGSVRVVSDAGHFDKDVSEHINLSVFERKLLDEGVTDEETAMNREITLAVEKLDAAREAHAKVEEKFVKALDFDFNEKVAKKVTEFLLG